MFSKEFLQYNAYFINRMNKTLEIPLKYIYKERTLVSITHDPNIILAALKQCTNVTIDDSKDILIPKITPIKNTIKILNISQEDDYNFRIFLSGTIKIFDYIVGNIADNCCALVFPSEDRAAQEFKVLSELKWKGDKLQVSLEMENLFETFELALQEKQAFLKFN